MLRTGLQYSSHTYTVEKRKKNKKKKRERTWSVYKVSVLGSQWKHFQCIICADNHLGFLWMKCAALKPIILVILLLFVIYLCILIHAYIVFQCVQSLWSYAINVTRQYKHDQIFWCTIWHIHSLICNVLKQYCSIFRPENRRKKFWHYFPNSAARQEFFFF